LDMGSSANLDTLIELNIVKQSFAQGNEHVASVQWSCANRAQQPTVSNVTSLSSSWAFDHQLGSSSYTQEDKGMSRSRLESSRCENKSKVSFNKLCTKKLHLSTIIQQVAFRQHHSDDKWP
jgi:hypothetical protein